MVTRGPTWSYLVFNKTVVYRDRAAFSSHHGNGSCSELNSVEVAAGTKVALLVMKGGVVWRR